MGGVRSALSLALKPLGYEIVKKRKPSGRNECPSVLLVTLPKSGTMFLSKTLSASLDLARIDISPGYFPIDNLDLTSLLEFAKGGYTAAAHIDASPFNLNLLSRYCDKWVVHVRDPRAALLSWTHFRDRPEIYDNPRMALRVFPLEPGSYHSSMSFSEKIDWQIEHYLPNLIRWIEVWCKVANDSAYVKRIVMTNHEQLAGRDVEFAQELMNSLDLTPKSGSIELARKDMSSHYRRGSKDEWRSVFTPAQIEKASKSMPHHLMDRFGWSGI